MALVASAMAKEALLSANHAKTQSAWEACRQPSVAAAARSSPSASATTLVGTAAVTHAPKPPSVMRAGWGQALMLGCVEPAGLHNIVCTAIWAIAAAIGSQILLRGATQATSIMIFVPLGAWG